MNDHNKSLVFRFEPVAYILTFRSLMLGLGGIIIMATIFGQIKADRFPAYEDIALSIAIPIAVYALLALGTYLLSFVYTVKVSSAGLRGSNIYGFFSSVQWQHIESASFYEMQGIPSIFVYAQNRKTPVAIPVWLRQPEQFMENVVNYAGSGNPLSKLFD